ncbi:MAG: hypothetical protein HY290_11720 [Planctomycetia bacterium]|nr:hypothetical protein [Planctomycetia bacterium]
MSLIALACGIAGLAIGYALGFRNGSISGELRALHITLQQMRSRRRGSGHHPPEHEPAERLE